MQKHKVIDSMIQTGMIPVFYHPNFETAKAVVRACYDGGVRAFEFTNRGAFAHEVFAELSHFCRHEMPDLCLGIGSVIDAGTTSLYLQLGAHFVVAPAIVPEMAAVCNRRGVLWSPGCGSLTEVLRAAELGSDVVKIFPGTQVGGPAFVKSVLGPCPWLQIMPTGGVAPTEANLRPWFEAGVACVGMGSKLFDQAELASGEFSGLTERVRVALALIGEIRGNKV